MSTRYVLHDPIGSGGMATVHLGQLHAPLGFTRTVAIKRLHPALSHQAEFAAMLVDEARITARVRHLNVIPTLDVFVESGECMLVMEYVEGESLGKVLRAASRAQTLVPLGVVSAILSGVLHGLHAAHVAKSSDGEPLGIIHRDVSPQNILVGSDGIARVFDFGVAKALGRLQQTRAGEFKGKLPYLAPEQFSEGVPDRRIDIYAASVTLWETLTARRLFDGTSEEEVFGKILQSRVPAPSELREDVPAELDELVLRGLSRAPLARFTSAEEMALALEQAVVPATAREVSRWLQTLAGEELSKRAKLVREMDGRRAAPAAATTTIPLIAPSPAPPPAPATAPTAPAAAPKTALESYQPAVTLRMTMPLAPKQGNSPREYFAAPAPPATFAPTPPESLATASAVAHPDAPVDPGRSRRLLVRASFGALLLICLLVAPASAWMALSDKAAAASKPTAVKLATAPVTAAPVSRAAPQSPTPTPEGAKPLAPAAPLVPPASPPSTNNKPAASHAPARTKPVASSPDYLSSPPFSQRH